MYKSQVGVDFVEIDLKAQNQLLYPYEVSVSHNSIDEWELTLL